MNHLRTSFPQGAQTIVNGICVKSSGQELLPSLLHGAEKELYLLEEDALRQDAQRQEHWEAVIAEDMRLRMGT